MTARSRPNLPPGVEIETFELASVRGGRGGRYDFLVNIPNGAHVHFFIEEGIQKFQAAVHRLNNHQQKQNPTFRLVVRVVGERDPKGPGFRVLRQDREVLT